MSYYKKSSYEIAKEKEQLLMDKVINKKRKGLLPETIVKDNLTSALLLCVGSHGRHDASIVWENRKDIKRVLVNDIDYDKIENMKAMYPTSWTYNVSDAFDLIYSLEKRMLTYDLVTCDCSSDMSLKVWENIEGLMDVSDKYVCFYATKERFFDSLGLDVTEDAVLNALKERKIDVEDVTLYLRNHKYMGGAYWIILK